MWKLSGKTDVPRVPGLDGSVGGLRADHPDLAADPDPVPRPRPVRRSQHQDARQAGGAQASAWRRSAALPGVVNSIVHSCVT